MDGLIESLGRTLARRTSRRGFLGVIGKALFGAAVFPLLPVNRATGVGVAELAAGGKNDQISCDYWRYCSMEGLTCACCGGTVTECPAGTFSSPTAWVGTCRNPGDGKEYVIAYRDCCGKNGCSQCFCDNDNGDMPIYRPQRDNGVFWCFGAKSFIVNCTTSVILGVKS